MRIFKYLTLALILILACSTALADPVQVYFSPSGSDQIVGSTFTIKILANIPADPGLVDFGFNLLWDNSLMRLDGVTGTDSQWDILWDVGTPESVTGLLFPTPTSPVSVSGSGLILANLSFTCLGEGSSTLNIATDPELVALGLQGFYGPDGQALDAAVTSTTVDQGTASVPEPSALLLLPAGLLGLRLWRKRK